MSPTILEIEAEIAKTLENAHVIHSAFEHVNHGAPAGFDLAACCAMAQAESGGRMIWGADPWDPGNYPEGYALPVALHEQPVTEANYHAYRRARNRGLQPQGCGITQLTSAGLQEEAERAGGCWIPFYNARVGFAFLASLFMTHPTPELAFAAYNGSGPAAYAYGARVAGYQSAWRQRFAAL